MTFGDNQLSLFSLIRRVSKNAKKKLSGGNPMNGLQACINNLVNTSLFKVTCCR